MLKRDSLRRHQQPNRCRNRSCERDRRTYLNLHEFGGVAPSVASSSLIDSSWRAWSHPAIQHGSKTKFSRGSNCEPDSQANRATRLNAEENERRSDNKPRHYPKRPFMKPALKPIGVGSHVLGQLSQVNVRHKESFTMPEVKLGLEASLPSTVRRSPTSRI